MRLVSLAVFLFTALAAIGPVRAQTTAPSIEPAPENLAAAHELIAVIRPMDQFKALLPALVQNLKGAIVQNRPEVEKQYDAMMPLFEKSAEQRVGELADDMATIYARDFTVDELHAIAAFYKSPTGQKLVAQQPVIAQQIMVLGQKFGQAVANDIRDKMQHPN